MYERIKKLIEDNHNIFITGSGGTGKSYNIGKIQKDFDCVLTSSTGVSALNINGCTVHAWSGVGIMDKDPIVVYKEIEQDLEKFQEIRDTKRLIIDEISMIDAHGLDYINKVLQLVMYGVDYVINNPAENLAPFGGIQVILVGDFFQLPPVKIGEPNESLRYMSNYKKVNRNQLPKIDFCFNSNVWTQLNLVPVLLKEVKRQSDKNFIETLQRIRLGDETYNDIALITQRTINKDFVPDDVTKIYFKNTEVDAENESRLSKLTTPLYTFDALDSINVGTIVPDFQPVDLVKLKPSILRKYAKFKTENRIPTTLKIKVGARVMLLSNYKFNLGLCNGSCGYVTEITHKYITVKFDNGVETNIERERIETKEGTRSWIARKQFPLRLAYAITVHKSQGMTLDKAFIDFSTGAFAAGQAYVALSRVKSLEGLFVSNFGGGSLQSSELVWQFYQDLEKNPLTIS